MPFVNEMVDMTNSNLPSTARRVTRGELLRVQGIIIGCSIWHPAERTDLWSPGTPLFPSPQVGKYMSKARFQQVWEAFSLTPDIASAQQDPWLFIDGFFAAFNELRKEVVKPGQQLILDELMIQWYGVATPPWMQEEGIFMDDAAPHATKIPRKPMSVGIEVICTLDRESLVMLYLAVQKGKTKMATINKQEFPSVKLAGACSLLRGTKPWWGSGRTVIGDDAFTSIYSCIECRARGLFYVGVVKRAHKGIPMKHFNGKDLKRGEATHVITNVDPEGTPVLATRWQDHKAFTIIGTAGTSNEGEPHTKRRRLANGDVRTFQVPRTDLVAKYFDNFHKVDVHNHMRQGGLKLEKFFQTHVWWKRVFSSILGIVTVDSFVCWRREPGNEDVSRRDFTRQLVQQLLENELDDARLLRSVPDDPVSPLKQQQYIPTIVVHDTMTIAQMFKRLHREPRPNLRRVCRVCGYTEAKMTCVTCSTRNPDDGSLSIYGLCGPGTGRDCVVHHCIETQ